MLLMIVAHIHTVLMISLSEVPKTKKRVRGSEVGSDHGSFVLAYSFPISREQGPTSKQHQPMHAISISKGDAGMGLSVL